MRIKYLGHASFLVTTAAGTRLQFDPYEPGGFNGAIGYGPFQEAADIVVISHDHADHACVGAVPGHPEVVKGRKSQTALDLEFRRLPAYHDPRRGAQRGENIITTCRVEGVSLCHLGDLGHVLSEGQAKEVGEVGILMLPVGGFFTIDAEHATLVMERLSPRVCIPMHYKTAKCNLPISSAEEFLRGKESVKRLGRSEVEITAEGLPPQTELWVLEPAL